MMIGFGRGDQCGIRQDKEQQSVNLDEEDEVCTMKLAGCEQPVYANNPSELPHELHKSGPTSDNEQQLGQQYNYNTISGPGVLGRRLIARPEASLDRAGSLSRLDKNKQKREHLKSADGTVRAGSKSYRSPTESSQRGLSVGSPSWPRHARKEEGENYGCPLAATAANKQRLSSTDDLNCEQLRLSGDSRGRMVTGVEILGPKVLELLDPFEHRQVRQAQVRLEGGCSTSNSSGCGGGGGKSSGKVRGFLGFCCRSVTKFKTSLVGAETERSEYIENTSYLQRDSPFRRTVLSFVGIADYNNSGRDQNSGIDRTPNKLVSYCEDPLVYESTPMKTDGKSGSSHDLDVSSNREVMFTRDEKIIEESAESSNDKRKFCLKTSKQQFICRQLEYEEKQYDQRQAASFKQTDSTTKETIAASSSIVNLAYGPQTILDNNKQLTRKEISDISNQSMKSSRGKRLVDMSDEKGSLETRRQQPATGSRANDHRRSTHCSSIGVATSDLNYDSSFSSINNISEGNNICTMKHSSSNESANHQNDELPRRKKDAPLSEPFVSSMAGKKRPPDGKEYILSVSLPDNKSLKRWEDRDNWDRNIEFLLAVIGFAVDLGNVWRFPYVCYKNGGGAFLIPYTIMFILGGLPIFYLEMSLGQYFSSGCLTVWRRVCPIAKGVGYAMCVLNFYTGLYYNTIISWAVYFFVESFSGRLPWTSCDNPWNSIDCKTIEQRQSLKSNETLMALNSLAPASQVKPIHYSSPTKDYFEREVLKMHLSTGIDDLGQIRPPLALYLAVVFICIYFAIWKGVKSTGKAVWITALLPYFVLIPLLVRGVFLLGASAGINYYLRPQWEKICDVNVWVEAAKQIYFSLGPGFGTLMALSSYNKFNHNCRRDALIAASVNYFASFISGLVIFAVLGYMATIENVDVSDVATEGPGLVFQVYPEGLATMQFSSMWSVLFFTMVITLGIDSTFGGLESVITGLCDEYPRVLRRHRGVFIGFLIVLIYICSLPTTTYGGNYVIYVLESYGTTLSLLLIVLFETIIICWVYGADRFCDNLEEMTGRKPGLYWRVCWKYISPTILLIIFFAACFQELSKYHILTNGDYTYPGWAPTIGLLMTGSSVCCIPFYAIYYFRTQTSGTFLERLRMSYRPIEEDSGAKAGRNKDIYVDALTVSP